jgi:hypothetical protein
MDKKIILIIVLVILITIVFALNFLTKKKTTYNPSLSPQTTEETSQIESWQVKKISYDGALRFIKIINSQTFRAVDITNKKIVDVDIESGDAKKILEEIPENISLVYWSKDGSLASIYTSEGISIVDLKNKKIDPLPQKVSFATPSIGGRYFLYGFNEETGAKIYFGDSQERKRIYSGNTTKKISEVVFFDFSKKTFYFLTSVTKDGVSTDLYKWQDGETSLVLENCASARYIDNENILIAISEIDNTVLIGSLPELKSSTISSTDINLLTYFNSMLYYLNPQKELVSEDNEVIFNNFPETVLELEATKNGIIVVTKNSLLLLVPPLAREEKIDKTPSPLPPEFVPTPKPSPTPTKSNLDESNVI